jgi:hypothetical protein
MYPVSFEADYVPEQSRLKTLFRYFIAIPWLLLSYGYGIVAGLFAFIAWFALLFAGRYPQGLYDFVAGYIRFSAQAGSFIYLLTDDLPPFGLNEENYPIRVDIAPPKTKYSRLKVFFRFIIGIPVMLLALVHFVILGVCSFLGFFAALITGRMPEGLWAPIRNATAYLTRANAYFNYLTEDYPPFGFDEEASRTAISQTETPALETQPAATREG